MRILAIFLLISVLAAAQASTDVVAVVQQGTKLVDSGELAAAQELYEKSLASHPGDPDLRFELGMVYFRRQNWAKAVENYRISIGNRPGRVKALFYLAEAYFMESDLERATETIGQAASIAPNDPQVCQKYGEYLSAKLETRTEGLSWLQKARRLNPALARIDFEIGKAQFDLTDFQSARASFETALKADSNNGETAFYLAESAANLGDWEKARDSYRLAIGRGYANASANYGMGRAFVELGDFDAALAPLQRAILLQSSLAKAHFQLGKAYRQLGRSNEAQHETRLFDALTDRVDTSSELKGSEEIAAWKQVRPLLEANQEQKALDLLARLPVADVLDHGEPHYLLGTMYYSLGRIGDAKRVLTLARLKAPQSARIAAYLGMVQLSGGETSAAEESFQSALALNPSEFLALIGMGGIRYQQQRWNEAASYLEKSRTADPGTLYLLCDAYFHMGSNEQALLTAEVIRILGAEKKPLLDELDALVKLHQKD